MDPIAFCIGPVCVRWYGLLIATALLIGFIGGSRMARKQGLNEDDFLTVIMVSAVCAIIGARVYYVIFNWGYYGQYPSEIIAIWHGGLAVHGGIIGGLLGIAATCRYYKMDIWQVCDIYAPWMILGQAIGRWGNFFNQEAYGYEVSPDVIPWAMYIDGAYRHPTFLYESLWNLAVFVILIVLIKKGTMHRGEIALSYFMLYSVGRVIVESFRTDSLMLGSLRMAQVMSIVMFVTALVIFVYRRKKYIKKE